MSKRILLSAITAASLLLGGCAIYPAYGPYGPAYEVGPPVIFAPVPVYRSYYGGHGYGYRYRHY